MGNTLTVVMKAADKYQKDRARLLDIIRDVQSELGCVPDEAMASIASVMGTSKVDVEGVVTFYHFFSKTSVGKYSVYLNNTPTSYMNGRASIIRAFEEAAGCIWGSTTRDGLIGLFDTSCVGMNDQEPAAIINGVVFTQLTPDKVKGIVADMKKGISAQDMVKNFGDGKNQSDLIRSMVNNNIRKKAAVIFADQEAGAGLKKAVAMKPEDVIAEIKKSGLRGRGGAGFATGMKWEFARGSEGAEKWMVCNADEGEPGTFKDRVLLTETPELVFEGMAVGGYAVGANKGLLYLRAEYIYLKSYLENVLENLRKKGVLGKNAGGKQGFDFDIRIQIGAGAYVCGEESALIESAEGKRGEPRNRPPFPVQKGFMGLPTSVNNVETYAAAARIMKEGAAWFKAIGTEQSAGTKVLSVSGDCGKPGVYEVDYGTTIQQLLDMVDGKDARCVMVGGPSGTFIGRKDYGRKICFNDLATGGSMMIFNAGRDLLDVVRNFMEFFVEESCGWCVPCRAGNAILLNKLETIIEGAGTQSDISDLESWCRIVKTMSRCGLGQTSPNPILTTIQNFREIYDAKVQKDGLFVPSFDLEKAVQASCKAAGRTPKFEEHH